MQSSSSQHHIIIMQQAILHHNTIYYHSINIIISLYIINHTRQISYILASSSNLISYQQSSSPPIIFLPYRLPLSLCNPSPLAVQPEYRLIASRLGYRREKMSGAWSPSYLLPWLRAAISCQRVGRRNDHGYWPNYDVQVRYCRFEVGVV